MYTGLRWHGIGPLAKCCEHDNASSGTMNSGVTMRATTRNHGIDLIYWGASVLSGHVKGSCS
jgi:hypothetical protein